MAPHPDRGRPEVDGFPLDNPHLQPGRRFLSGLERRAIQSSTNPIWGYAETHTGSRKTAMTQKPKPTPRPPKPPAAPAAGGVEGTPGRG
jgi:hypothetical protein